MVSLLILVIDLLSLFYHCLCEEGKEAIDLFPSLFVGHPYPYLQKEGISYPFPLLKAAKSLLTLPVEDKYQHPLGFLSVLSSAMISFDCVF